MLFIAQIPRDACVLEFVSYFSDNSYIAYIFIYNPATSVPEDEMTVPGKAFMSFVTCDPRPSGLARKKRSLGEVKG